MQKGDSGSIVIDAVTDAIYGHVIGVNPIGEVYVSPYAAIFEQIRKMFPRQKVEILDPVRTLKPLVAGDTIAAGANVFQKKVKESNTKLNEVKQIAVLPQQLRSYDSTTTLGSQQHPLDSVIYH